MVLLDILEEDDVIKEETPEQLIECYLSEQIPENEWYELAVSNEGVAKDWKVDFSGLKIRLFNEHMNWLREIDLKNMTAYMKFPSGEYYLYECNNLER